MDPRLTITACLSAFALSVILTRLMIWINIRDIPGRRSSHTKTTPRAGGLSIMLVFYGLWAVRGFTDVPQDDPYFSWIFSLMLCGIMGWMGLIDDIIGLRALVKLIFQVCLSLIYISLGGEFQEFYLPYFGSVDQAAWRHISSFVWIIVFINTFNFIDGLNGMASGATLIACFFWFLITFNQGCMPLAYSALILMMATLGFFVFNFPKGKIFMGDTGSLFIGGLFMSWAFLGTMPAFGQISSYTIPLIFCIYLYDTAMTRLRRMRRGYSFLADHQEHYFQLLNRLGWSHTQVSSLYMFFCFLQGTTALVMQSYPQSTHFYFFLPFLGMYGFCSHMIVRSARRHGLEV